MDTTSRACFESLSRCLEAQIDAAEQLCFKFEVQGMLLASGRHRFLSNTTSELESAAARLEQTDRALRAALTRAAAVVGLSPESTLREVAASAPEPWSFIFGQHRETLFGLIEEVRKLSGMNRRLLASGQAAIHSALSFLGAEVPTGYTASGTAPVASGSARLLDARA